jgi:WhiB family redox-sensing transcriptional regulator
MGHVVDLRLLPIVFKRRYGHKPQSFRLNQQHLEALHMTIAPVRPSRQAADGSWIEDWAPLGACAKSDPDALFVQGAAQQTAKIVCQRCPVIAECLADALDNRTEFGVWGGMTERERRALLKRRPNIPSWAALFAQARHSTTVESA